MIPVRPVYISTTNVRHGGKYPIIVKQFESWSRFWGFIMYQAHADFGTHSRIPDPVF